MSLENECPGEFALFKARLVQALDDIKTNDQTMCPHPKPFKMTNAECAKQWLCSDEFEMLCDLLNLSVSAIRKSAGIAHEI